MRKEKLPKRKKEKKTRKNRNKTFNPTTNER